MARINSLEWRSFRKYRQAPARAKRQAPHLLSGLASLPASPAHSFIPSPMPVNSAFGSNVLPLAHPHSVEALTQRCLRRPVCALAWGAPESNPSAKCQGARSTRKRDSPR
jgi:hypothetical protein